MSNITFSVNDSVQEWIFKLNKIFGQEVVNGAFNEQKSNYDDTVFVVSGGNIRSGTDIISIPGASLTLDTGFEYVVGIDLNNNVLIAVLSTESLESFVPLFIVTTNNTRIVKVRDTRTWLSVTSEILVADAINELKNEADPFPQYTKETRTDQLEQDVDDRIQKGSLEEESIKVNEIDDLDNNPLNISRNRVTTSTGTQTVSEALNRRGVKFTALRAPTSGTFDPEDYLETATKVTEGLDCYTLSYHAPAFPSNTPFSGGNDYTLVAGGTGASDGGSFIDLSGSGLQAQGLFHGGVADAGAFGCVGDGRDNVSELQSFFNFVMAGNKGTIGTGGVYGLSTGIVLNGDDEFDLSVNSGVTFYAMPGFPSNKKLIQVNEGLSVNASFRWIGGKLDGFEMPNSAPGEANDLFYITATNYSSVTIHLDRTYTGPDWLSSGSDSHVFASANNLDIDIKEAIGAEDAAVYISGDSINNTQGYRARVRGNYKKCNVAVIFKRDYEDVDVDIFTEDCLNGAGFAADAAIAGVESVGGEGGTIRVNSRRTERSGFIQGGARATMYINAVDIGVKIAGYTSASAKAVNLSACTSALVYANVANVHPEIVRTDNFLGCDIFDREIDGSVVKSTDNCVHLNTKNLGRSAVERNGSDRNALYIQDQGSLSAPIVEGLDSYLEWFKSGQRLSAYSADVAGSYTSAAQEVTTSGSAPLLKEYASSDNVQWLMRNGASIPGRFGYNHANARWEWRAGGSGVVFNVESTGPRLPGYSVAGLPVSGVNAGVTAYASNGRKSGEAAGAGTGVMVFYDGANWVACDSGQTVTA